MPRAQASDGVELHWEERGSGPTVLLAPYWSYHPSVHDPITAELEADHRVVRYDDRGCGESSRVGPYDPETGARDLETVCEAAGGGPMIAVGMVDATNRAVRVAARRGDLIDQVVAIGVAPVGREAFSGSDSMISSSTVVAAFMQMLETDYRGAIRSMAEATNPQMTADEVRERTRVQVEYTPQEAAVTRVRAWADDEAAAEPARDLGDRLTILVGDNNVGGGWFPDPAQMADLYSRSFPEAMVKRIADGIVSAPELTAAVVRERSRVLDSAR